MSHCLDFCSSDFTSFKMVYNITEFTPKKHRIVLVMKPKYLGMWVDSAVKIFWIAMWVPQRKYSGNKGDDTGLSENLTQMWEKKKKQTT